MKPHVINNVLVGHMPSYLNPKKTFDAIGSSLTTTPTAHGGGDDTPGASKDGHRHDDLQALVREHLDKTGISADEAARQARVKPQIVDNILTGKLPNYRDTGRSAKRWAVGDDNAPPHSGAAPKRPTHQTPPTRRPREEAKRRHP